MAVLRVPRITTTQRTTLVMLSGEIVFDTDLQQFFGGDGVTPGGIPLATGGGGGPSNKLTTIARNNTGATIPAASVVYFSGASGNLPTLALSQANGEMQSTKTIGITSTSIANNQTGEVVIFGLADALDTTAFPAGSALWLSPAVPGGMTTTKPSAPNHMVFVGFCTRSHPTAGAIEVKIQNGFELEELHNVSAQSPVGGDVLRYDGNDLLWKNHALTASDIGLGSVDNTSDADKPISTATQSALNDKEDLSNKSSDTALGSSDSLYPTQNAVRAYVDDGLSMKQDTITGAATTIVSSDLPAERILQSNGSGKVAVTNVTPTQLENLIAGEIYQYKDLGVAGPAAGSSAIWPFDNFALSQNRAIAGNPENYLRSKWLYTNDSATNYPGGPFNDLSELDSWLSVNADNSLTKIRIYDHIDPTIPIPTSGGGYNSLDRRLWKDATGVPNRSRRYYQSIIVKDNYFTTNTQFCQNLFQTMHGFNPFTGAPEEFAAIWKSPNNPGKKRNKGGMAWNGSMIEFNGGDNFFRKYYDTATSTFTSFSSELFTIGRCKVIDEGGSEASGSVFWFQKNTQMTNAVVYAFPVTNGSTGKAVLIRSFNCDRIFFNGLRIQQDAPEPLTIEAVTQRGEDGQAKVFPISMVAPESGLYLTGSADISSLPVFRIAGSTVRFRTRNMVTNKVSLFWPFELFVKNLGAGIYALRTRPLSI